MVDNGKALQLHPLVESILSTGMIETPDGGKIAASSHIPRDECELIYSQIRETGATQAVEVGMAFGVSTLCLCDALQQNASRQGVAAHLVVMDPAQNDHAWRGMGIHHVESSGFGHMVKFHERPSQQVLPELVESGWRAQFAFIDGWHTFDHTLVDFFYIDRLLVRGGIIVFDDVGYQAINAVVRFVLSNRCYELAESLQDPNRAASSSPKSVVKKGLARLARTDRTPTAENSELFSSVELAYTVALKKADDDHRRWDHFAAF